MSIPSDIKPLTLSVRSHPFDGADWIFEPKADGYRALLYVDSKRAALVSRNGRVFARFDRLAASIAVELRAILAQATPVIRLSVDEAFMHRVRGCGRSIGASRNGRSAASTRQLDHP